MHKLSKQAQECWWKPLHKDWAIFSLGPHTFKSLPEIMDHCTQFDTRDAIPVRPAIACPLGSAHHARAFIDNLLLAG